MIANQQELKLETNPAQECPYFDTCSVNLCPLDKGFGKLTYSPFDKEINCRLRRSSRKKLALKYGLVYIRLKKRNPIKNKGKIKDKQASEGILQETS